MPENSGKLKDQAPSEPEPSKRPKGPTTSVRWEKANRLTCSRSISCREPEPSEAGAPAVDLPEGAPVAVPEVQAASSPVAPDLEDGLSELELDSKGEELGDSDFDDDEVVGLREPTVPKRKKKDVEGRLWRDCHFGYVVPLEFPGRPKVLDVLSSYGSHIARYVYEGFHRVPLTPISHGRKLRLFNKQLPVDAWFHDMIAKTSLADLAKTRHMLVDPYLISAFVERWHEETSSFHMPAGEVT
ncbi:hypothetical protein QL285_063042 [Trifolium repens]|nr:hypothetical protein QL285_063042 [Trifolium repens]